MLYSDRKKIQKNIIIIKERYLIKKKFDCKYFRIYCEVLHKDGWVESFIYSILPKLRRQSMCSIIYVKNDVNF